MRLICPSCGAMASADAWASDAHAREAVRIVSELPRDVASRALQYAALFRPEGGRGLQWKKAVRILSELASMVSQSHIQWEQRAARPNDSRAWGQAMERVISRPPKRLPLESHGYLRKIAYEIADEIDKVNENYRNAHAREAAAARRLQGAACHAPSIANEAPVETEAAAKFRAILARATKRMPEK